MLVASAPDGNRFGLGLGMQRLDGIEEGVDRHVVHTLQVVAFKLLAKRAVRVGEHVERAFATALDGFHGVAQVQGRGIDSADLGHAGLGDVDLVLVVDHRAVEDDELARLVDVCDPVAQQYLEQTVHGRCTNVGGLGVLWVEAFEQRPQLFGRRRSFRCQLDAARATGRFLAGLQCQVGGGGNDRSGLSQSHLCGKAHHADDGGHECGANDLHWKNAPLFRGRVRWG